MLKVNTDGGEKTNDGAGELFFRTDRCAGALEEPKKSVATTEMRYVLSAVPISAVPAASWSVGDGGKFLRALSRSASFWQDQEKERALADIPLAYMVRGEHMSMVAGPMS